MSTKPGFDRREFLAGAGAAVVAGALPLTLAVAPVPAGAAEPRAQLADWHIDDMWGVYPRPSETIGYGRPRGDGEIIAAAAVDWQFVA